VNCRREPPEGIAADAISAALYQPKAVALSLLSPCLPCPSGQTCQKAPNSVTAFFLGAHVLEAAPLFVACSAVAPPQIVVLSE
jgi:hypothetical protein